MSANSIWNVADKILHGALHRTCKATLKGTIIKITNKYKIFSGLFYVLSHLLKVLMEWLYLSWCKMIILIVCKHHYHVFMQNSIPIGRIYFSNAKVISFFLFVSKQWIQSLSCIARLCTVTSLWGRDPFSQGRMWRVRVEIGICPFAAFNG